MVYFTNTERSVLSEYNNIILDSSQNNAEYNLSQGNITSATSSTITLPSGTDNEYINLVIQIIDGNGINQCRYITDFTSQIATITPAWDIVPENNSKYIIHVHSGRCQDQTQNNKIQTIRLDAAASSIDEYYNNNIIKLMYGCGEGELATIIGYDGTNKIATIDHQITRLPRWGTLYAIFGESGLSPGGSDSTHIILDGNQSAAVRVNHYIEIYNGMGIGQARRIVSISDNNFEVDNAWDVEPDSTSRYTITGGWVSSKFEKILKYATLSIHTWINHIIDKEQMGLCIILSSHSNGKYPNYTISEISFVNPNLVHSSTITSSYVRVKAVDFGMGLNGSIETIFGSYKTGNLTSSLNDDITNNDDCTLTRSIISGESLSGKYRNIRADYDGNMNININNPLDAFGSVSMTEPQQFIEINFLHNYINPMAIETRSLNGGSVAAIKNLVSVSTGTNPMGKVELQTIRRIRYSPGLAIKVRFTALFSAPVADSYQLIGFGDVCDGIFVGYNGLEFGILLRNEGKQEIRRLTITQISSSNDDIIITLNGVSCPAISIDSSDSTDIICKKIASTDFSEIGSGWQAFVEDGSVLFISNTAEPLNGTYSYAAVSSDSVGTFNQILAGAVPDDTWYQQYNWNMDRCYNIEDMPMINWQKGNVFEFGIQWLGFGNISISIENPETGKFTICHKIIYANMNTLTSLENPNLPLIIHTSKWGGADATDLTIKSGSLAAFIMGQSKPTLGNRLGVKSIYNSAQGALVANTYINILTLYNSRIFNNQINVSEKYLLTVSVGIDAGSSIQHGGVFTFFANPNIDDSTNLTWTPRMPGISSTYYCTDPKTITGGVELISFPCCANDSISKTALDFDVFIYPGNSLTIAFMPFENYNSTPASETANITASMAWISR
jgi:hypothetical protein